MERAAGSGFMAANALLGLWDGREEPIYTVPTRGLLAGLSGLAQVG
jgi:isorenieratene synthase